MALNSLSTPSIKLKTGSCIQTSSQRCTQCTPRETKNTRNLILCIDSPGTSTNDGSKNTNVAKLFAKLDLESTQPEQYAYYSGGVDAHAPRSLHILNRMERAFSDKLDKTRNTKEIVKDAYRWLARMYKEGDQIYLFGFSRGAHQVRVLAEMIHEVGLLRITSEDLIGTAYDCYEAIRSGKRHTTTFKDEHTRKGLRVHFIGVWDTLEVSPFDHMKRDLSLPTSSAHVCHFRHALALDEPRVNFIPEYFRGMNFQADKGESGYLGKKNIEFKEVWFAGSHSDVGGQNRPGTFHHAGNVSLLWMRREAAANSLVLKPTDIVWLPDDLDFGVNNHARRFHRLQPRRVLPGQKIHTSVLYANMYKPKATLGEGFDIDIPITQSALDNMVSDGKSWETGLFDGTAAPELVASLGSEQGVASIYLDRLLFMLRFNEGKQYIKNIPDWQDNFMTIINSHDYVPLVRLVVIIAYFEASCDHEVHPNRCVLLPTELSRSMQDDAQRFLNVIQDGPRVVGLLRSLTKHQILVERFLTREVLGNLVESFDAIILEHGRKFGQVMDCLNCLLQCVDIRTIVVAKLGANLPDSSLSRLSRILEVDDSRLLTAALRMMRTLARIPEARAVCSVVRPRIKILTRTDEQPLGPLAVEVLLSLYDPNDQSRQQGESRSPLLTSVSNQVDSRDAHTRTNLARALVLFNRDRYDLENGQDHGASPAQQMLRNIFGLDATGLDEPQINLIGDLKMAVQKGGIQERTAATMALLKLCETENVRVHLCNIKLLDVFVTQLRRKDSALLAAYALATCVRYDELEEPIKDDEKLPEYIINMIRLNYLDDAVGRVEGFQIFKDLMQCADLRRKINDYGITDILRAKLSKDDPKEIRTGLVCLDIFLSFDASGNWVDDLVETSLARLNDSDWKAQMEGVRILSALAQTEHGKTAISPRIQEIVEMLLPQDYLLIRRPTVPRAASPSSEGRGIARMTIKPSQARSQDAPPSWMLGPACALRLLAQSETLRDRTRKTVQYSCLKNLFLSGALVGRRDTPAWRLRTPNRADVINMLDMVIKVVDREQSEENLISIRVEDVVPPHIRRWDRLAMWRWR